MTIDKELARAASRDARGIFGAGGLWCWLRVHRWSRWEESTLVKVFNAGTSAERERSFTAQRRYCSRCGVKDVRTV